ncbi:hypothetical protein LTR56_020903 [Elasticomyces elasticus]|nr:hypothetical protein LTR56_020903 [Elasticomyces elasticus]KAK3654302.1 hypothetical protein LTR22_010778 [Elasticomyces elasticus]KAK4920235.1 hypothetical protein LTR49_012186 [Elasticomyces elasticus]KAK5749834.1 hypothetical protein LTS12_020124 [Elasticomyces elasticus]
MGSKYFRWASASTKHLRQQVLQTKRTGTEMALTAKMVEMSLADAPSAKIPPKFSPFRFFDLARELRNQIYRELTYNQHSHPTARSKPRFELTVFRLPNIRLVSKQLRHEYDDEVLRTAVLVINESSMASSWDSVKVLGTGGYQDRVRLLEIVRNVILRYKVLCSDPATGSGQMRPIKDIQGKRIRQLSSIQMLTICEGAVDSIIGFAGELAQDVLPRIVLRVELTLDVVWTDMLKKETWDAQSFFGMASAEGLRSDIQFSPHLFVSHSMFRAHPDVQELDGLAECMDCSTENKIVYEAKPSSDEGNWHGLDLTTFKAGTWHYQSIVAEAKILSAYNEYEDSRYDYYDDPEDHLYYYNGLELEDNASVGEDGDSGKHDGCHSDQYNALMDDIGAVGAYDDFGEFDEYESEDDEPTTTMIV